MLSKCPVCSSSAAREEAAFSVDDSRRNAGPEFLGPCRQGSVFVEIVGQHSLRVRKFVGKFTLPVRGIPARPQALLLKYEAKMFFANRLQAK